MASRLLLLGALVAALAAAEHRFTYVGYDHMLDYDPSTGNVAVFDFRRSLDPTSQCDVFIAPPLIKRAKFVDAMADATPPSEIEVSFLGYEDFLVHHPATGNFVIRRCSGFMPQQTQLPCEVRTVGKSASVAGSHRFFYAGPNLVIRWHMGTSHYELMHYDADVHGSGNPFSVRVSGELPLQPSLNMSFARLVVEERVYMLVLEELSGKFVVHKLDITSDGTGFNEIAMDGEVGPGHSIRSLDENNAVVFAPETGDFEVWRFDLVENKLVIVTVKQDTITGGHPCDHGSRYECVTHANCGWCEESVRCFNLDSNRKPCDGSMCSNIVDMYSPDSKKYQRYESPNPAYVVDEDTPPTINPKSPLRDLSQNSANPSMRDGDLSAEQIEGLSINPSEGLVFVPPPNAAIPEMDRYYEDPTSVPLPNVKQQENTMNAVAGKKLATSFTSPPGVDQSPPPAVSNATSNATRNTIIGALPSTTRNNMHEEKLAALPEIEENPLEIPFKPSDDGTAREEDLMNTVRSHYSSLVPKGSSLEVARPEVNDKPKPSATEEFVPRDTAHKKQKKARPAALLPPTDQLVDPNTMEKGVTRQQGTASEKIGSVVQSSAMNNAQYTSESIRNPSVMSPEQITKEHEGDLTGQQGTEPTLPPRADEPIVEGWQTIEVPLSEHSQSWAGVNDTRALTAPAPTGPSTEALREEQHQQEEKKAEEKEEEEKAVAKELEEKASHISSVDTFESGPSNPDTTHAAVA